MLNYLKPEKLSVFRLISGITIIITVVLFSSMIQPEGTGEGYNIPDNVSETGKSAPLTKMTVDYNNRDEQISDKPDMQNDPSKKNKNNTNEVFTVVENPPQFTGGDEARIAYMQKNISYPEQAKKDKIEGTVYVTYVIEKDGQVSNAKILRGIGGGCDEVALTAIQNMPPWKPGMEKGKPVRVQFNMPVSFKLGGKEKATDAGYTEPAKPDAVEDDVFVVVEISPQYPGGDDARVEYLVNSITYPVEAKNKGIQGIVYTTFIIEKDGAVSNVKVLRGVHKSLDEEAIRVVKSMPNWKPGMQRGKPVRVQYNMPLKFSLEKNEKKK